MHDASDIGGGKPASRGETVVQERAAIEGQPEALGASIATLTEEREAQVERADFCGEHGMQWFKCEGHVKLLGCGEVSGNYA